jgi:hypothetical protein
VAALAFAGLLYAVGSAGRPRQFAVDEVAIDWMDDASPVAARDVGLRVTAPRRARLALTIPGDPVLTGPGRHRGRAFLGFGSGDGDPSWDVRLDTGVRVVLPLRPWSYADVELRGVRRLPGTVARLPDGRLRNDTGQGFLQAVYIERGTVRRLGPMAAGAALDPAAVAASPLVGHVGRCGAYPGTLGGAPCFGSPGREEARRGPPPPFDLLELLRGWPRDGGHAFDSRSGLFLGLAEGPGKEAELVGVDAAARRHVVTIVSFRVGP